MHVSNYCSSPLLIDTIVIIVQSSNQCLLSLVQADGDVTTDAGRQVDLGLEVELDADEQSGVLLLALSVDSALEELASRLAEAARLGRSREGLCGRAGQSNVLGAAATAGLALSGGGVRRVVALGNSGGCGVGHCGCWVWVGCWVLWIGLDWTGKMLR